MACLLLGAVPIASNVTLSSSLLVLVSTCRVLCVVSGISVWPVSYLVFVGHQAFPALLCAGSVGFVLQVHALAVGPFVELDFFEMF